MSIPSTFPHSHTQKALVLFFQSTSQAQTTMSNRTVFITGGSGYIGSNVTKQLIARGYTVKALSRSETNDAKLSELGAIPVRGDLKTHHELLTQMAQEADGGVIHIGNTIAGDHTLSAVERLAQNDAATAAIVKGLKGSGRPMVIATGSLAAAEDPEGRETDEKSPGWGDEHPLAFASRPKDESIVQDGVRVSYLRLAPWVYGRSGSGVALLMKQWGAMGKGIVVEGGKKKTSTVYVDDAANAFLLALEKAEAGEEFNVTSETNVEFRQIAEAICEVLGVETMDVGLADAKGMMGDFFAAFLSSSNRAASMKAREILGWVPKAEKGIVDEIKTGSYVELAESLKKKESSA